MNELTQPTDPNIPRLKEKPFPVHIWHTSQDCVLSATEKLLCDTYVETMSFTECERKLEKEFGRTVRSDVVKRWFEQKQNMKDYVQERFRDLGILNSWTKDKWVSVLTQHMMAGMESIDPAEIKRVASELASSAKDDGKTIDVDKVVESVMKTQRQSKLKRLKSGDLMAMKLVGESMGWLGKQVQHNDTKIAVQFVQSDGKE